MKTMKKKIYIHIGPAKTGTKTIQRGLRINEQRLTHQGYLCPQTGRQYKKYAAQFQLGFELHKYNQEQDHHTLHKLIEEIAEDGTNDVIISDENLRKLGAKKIQLLRKALEPHEVFIIMYLRRQDRIFQSHWIQEVNNFRHLTPELIREYIQENRWADNFKNYNELIQDWGAVFGRDHLRVRVLEKEQLGEGLFQDFLSICGIKRIQPYKVPDNENESVGLKTVEALYLFKKYLYGGFSQADFDESFRLKFERISRKISKNEYQNQYAIKQIFRAVNAMKETAKRIKQFAEKKSWDAQRLNLIDAELFELVASRYDESNRAIAKEFFGREQLFLEPFNEKEITPFLKNKPDEDEYFELFNFIHSNFHQDARKYAREYLEQLENKPQEVLNHFQDPIKYFMINRKIYIHIGPAETGTKTIQRGLRMNQNLLKHHRYLCPETGRKFDKYAAQFKLGFEMYKYDIEKDFHTLKEMEDEILQDRDVTNIIISDENLRKLSLAKIRILKNAFKSYEVFIIMYLRRQDKILQSHWMQEVNNINYFPPSPFREYIGKSLYSGNYQEYNELIHNWGEVFGRNHLCMNVLEREQIHGNLMHDFLRLCEMKEIEKLRIPENENESPGLKTLEVIFLIKNYLYKNFNEKEFKESISQLKTVLYKENINLIEHPEHSLNTGIYRAFTTAKEAIKIIHHYAEFKKWDLERLNLIDAELYETVRARYAADNHKIAREFFGRDELFLEPFREEPITPFLRKELPEEEYLELFEYIRQNFNPNLTENAMEFLRILEQDPKELFHQLQVIQAAYLQNSAS